MIQNKELMDCCDECGEYVNFSYPALVTDEAGTHKVRICEDCYQEDLKHITCAKCGDMPDEDLLAYVTVKMIGGTEREMLLCRDCRLKLYECLPDEVKEEFLLNDEEPNY